MTSDMTTEACLVAHGDDETRGSEVSTTTLKSAVQRSSLSSRINPKRARSPTYDRVPTLRDTQPCDTIHSRNERASILCRSAPACSYSFFEGHASDGVVVTTFMPMRIRAELSLRAAWSSWYACIRRAYSRPLSQPTIASASSAPLTTRVIERGRLTGTPPSSWPRQGWARRPTREGAPLAKIEVHLAAVHQSRHDPERHAALPGVI